MFFGVSLIFNDLLQSQQAQESSSNDDDDHHDRTTASRPRDANPNAPNDPSSSSASSLAQSTPTVASGRTVRSPIALLLFGVALLMSACLLVGVVVAVAPMVFPATMAAASAAMQHPEVWPWAAVAALAVALLRRERRARVHAEHIADSIRSNDLDAARADTYQAKYVVASPML